MDENQKKLIEAQIKDLTRDCKGFMLDEMRKSAQTDEAFRINRKQTLDAFEKMERDLLHYIIVGGAK